MYGGILADVSFPNVLKNATDTLKDMGLGKSLSLLALVCSSLDSLTDQEESPENGMSRATLIVTPKSSMSQIFIFCINISLTVLAIPGWQQQIKRY